MKFFIGTVILLFGIYMMTDLSLKTRYTRKILSKKIRHILVLFFDYFLVNQTNHRDHEIYIYSNSAPYVNNKKKNFYRYFYK